MKKLIIASAALFALSSFMADAKCIVIGADTKVFETPVAKDEYCAVNDSDQPVILRKGMAFKVLEEKAGWYVIEYSPGLRGMLMTNVIADVKSVSAPGTGVFTVSNNQKEKVSVAKSAKGFILNSADKNYNGDLEDNVIIFKNADGSNAYSVTVLNGKPMVFTYSNSVTKFF